MDHILEICVFFRADYTMVDFSTKVLPPTAASSTAAHPSSRRGLLLLRPWAIVCTTRGGGTTTTSCRRLERNSLTLPQYCIGHKKCAPYIG